MLHLSTLDTTTLELLRKLQSIPALCKTRLVGGTALALQIGHRKSIDLDFFGKIEVEKDELVIATNRCFDSIERISSYSYLFVEQC